MLGGTATTRRTLALAALGACAVACGRAGTDPDAGALDAGLDAGVDAWIPDLPPTAAPRFHEVWQIGTHNSYWVNLGATGDAFASGVQERLADQILFDHARTIEIDVHRDLDTPGAFDVYHTTNANSLCPTLEGCLGALAMVRHVLPEHEPITVVIELKELAEPNFDAAHTIDDLDRVIETALGDALYRPAEFMERCPDVTTLEECAAQQGWPEVTALRGRVIVAILGNWDTFGAQATRDWIDYAIGAEIRSRAAFPMASSWKLDWDALSREERDPFTREELGAAARQSIFLQIESLDDPRIDDALRRRSVIRVDGAFDAAAQRERIARGMQIMQTDWPWLQEDDRGPAQPLRPLEDIRAPLIEPGIRLALAPGAPAFAYWTGADPAAWEAAIVSGSADARFGCLRAEAEPPSTDAVEICRTKIDADRSEGAPGDPAAESVTIRVSACRGACSSTEHRAPAGAHAAWGDLVRMEIDGTCARALVADGFAADGTPSWQELARSCFDAALVRQRIARAADAPASAGPSLFVGVRRDGVAVRASDVAGVRVGDVEDPSALVDSSSP